MTIRETTQKMIFPTFPTKWEKLPLVICGPGILISPQVFFWSLPQGLAGAAWPGAATAQSHSFPSAVKDDSDNTSFATRLEDWTCIDACHLDLVLCPSETTCTRVSVAQLSGS